MVRGVKYKGGFDFCFSGWVGILENGKCSFELRIANYIFSASVLKYGNVVNRYCDYFVILLSVQKQLYPLSCQEKNV